LTVFPAAPVDAAGDGTAIELDPDAEPLAARAGVTPPPPPPPHAASRIGSSSRHIRRLQSIIVVLSSAVRHKNLTKRFTGKQATDSSNL
jgi:hypothetical protein